MPGVYREGAWDIAGTLVGVVERSRILGPERVREGDALLALPPPAPTPTATPSSARWWRARTSPPPSPNSAKALKKPSSAPTGPT